MIRRDYFSPFLLDLDGDDNENQFIILAQDTPPLMSGEG
jgi:hypothetical protein